MPTANFYIQPSDGWVEIANAPKFARVSGFPHSHPYYVAAGSSAPSLTAAAATGTVTFTGLPTANQHVIIGSETWTFKASRVNPFEVAIGADASATGDNLVTAITADSALITASNAAGVVTVTAKAVGTQGNYAMSENATNTAVSGANMTGGAEQVVGVLVCHHPLKINVTMTEKLYARVQSPVPNANRGDGSLRVDVLTIT